MCFRGPNISSTLVYFLTWTGDYRQKGAHVNQTGGDHKCEGLSGLAWQNSMQSLKHK